MNTTQPLTDLQIACDTFVINHMTRLPNGDISLPWSPDEWPAGASASDIAASYERVRANLRRKPNPIAVARAYRDATPTESMVVAEATEQAEAPAPTRGDHLFAVGVAAAFWFGSVAVAALVVIGAITVAKWFLS